MRRAVSVIFVFTALAAPLRAPGVLVQQPLAQEPLAQEPLAQEPQQPENRPAEFDNPHFAFHPVDDGYLRLDMRTGAVASCHSRAVGWACVLAPDERVAVDAEIARLKRENASLKNALLERGLALPDGIDAAPPEPALVPSAPLTAPAAEPQIAAGPPAEAPVVEPPAMSGPDPAKPAGAGDASRDKVGVNRVINVIEQAWRRLVDMMANIQRDMQKKT